MSICTCIKPRMFILRKLLQAIKWDNLYGEAYLGGWKVQQLLFENIMDWWDWEAYSRDLNTHFDDLKKNRKDNAARFYL